MKNLRNTFQNYFLFSLLLVLLFASSCGDSGSSSTSSNASSFADESTMATSQKVNNHHNHQHHHGNVQHDPNFRACSYDGKPIKLNPSSFQTTRQATEIIDKIMSFVGLPQNFIIKQSPEVPNALAVILLDHNKVPQRIIAFNSQFMATVMKATENNDWAPISILAHEIGHHLCGHTITAGGSQPPLELEADKFSGFVLQKMGAKLEDAQEAMSKLTTEAVSKTHPPRSQRLRAIKEGWDQACKQNQWGDCKNPNMPTRQPQQQETNTVSNSTNNSTTTSSPTPNASSTVQNTSNQTPITSPPTTKAEITRTRAQSVLLPRLSESEIPTKFDRYIYDETNLLDETIRANINQQLQQMATDDQLEIVTIITNDLQGRNLESYAYDMLHQLRVGRMDIGNGACLVIHPAQKSYHVALMPGLRFNVKEGALDLLKRRVDFIYQYLDYIEKTPRSRDSYLKIVEEWIIRSCDGIRDAATSNFMDWTVRYQSIADMQAAAKNKTGNNPIKDDPVFRKLVSFQGKVVNTNGATHNKNGVVNVPADGRAIEVELPDRQYVVLLLNQYSEALYPSKIEQGKSYSFIARENSLYLLNLKLISYDLLE